MTQIAYSNSSTGAAPGTLLPRKALQCLSFAFFCCAFVFAADAQTPTPEMSPMSPALEQRLKKLETELRCLVCQNQTLA
ncbi:MAG: cytochrome c-type biogenesis protein CcmH, partial [Burkholderiales bacterium]|nr:cytochrome c-type biogenesis protein CcmH [Burkholderiales bacterium]